MILGRTIHSKGVHNFNKNLVAHDENVTNHQSKGKFRNELTVTAELEFLSK